jgi:hypothetical protein
MEGNNKADALTGIDEVAKNGGATSANLFLKPGPFEHRRHL